jgi:OPT family oligopeptide transporter
MSWSFLRHWPEQATPRALLAGVFIGGLMCFSNMYFGLQTGWVTMGSLQSTLLGFGLMRLLRRATAPGAHGASTDRRRRVASWFDGFCAHENVVLQTVAVASATMPLAGGFVGIIPALRCLPGGDAVELSVGQQLLWAAALAFFGVFFAVPLRKQTILREKLRFPSGTATAKMVAVLFRLRADDVDQELHANLTTVSLESTPRARSVAPSSTSSGSEGRNSGDSSSSSDVILEPEGDAENEMDDWEQRWRLLFITFGCSAAFALLSYFIPILLSVPLFSWFGFSAATEFGWTLTPSLSYVGQGMIMGHRTGWSMLLGAIFGWAFLGPFARQQDWATGPVNNWETGAKGWILWVSLSIMLAESMSSLLVLLGKSVWRSRKHPFFDERCSSDRRKFSRFSEPSESSGDSDASSKAGTGSVQQDPDDGLARSTLRRRRTGPDRTHQDIHDPASPDEQVPVKFVAAGLAISSLFCVVVLALMFDMKWYEPVVAVVAAMLVSVLAVRALGETDLNPVSGVGKVSQILFAGVAPGAIVPNLVAGAVAEAGAQQAGDLMQDLKCGHLVRASPRAQFVGQLVSPLPVWFFVFVFRGSFSDSFCHEHLPTHLPPPLSPRSGRHVRFFSQSLHSAFTQQPTNSVARCFRFPRRRCGLTWPG